MQLEIFGVKVEVPGRRTDARSKKIWSGRQETREKNKK